MLSYITLYPREWKQHSYVALCGVGGQAMLWMLEQYTQLQQISLCLDNDEAGHKASERLETQLSEKDMHRSGFYHRARTGMTI